MPLDGCSSVLPPQDQPSRQAQLFPREFPSGGNLAFKLAAGVWSCNKKAKCRPNSSANAAASPKTEHSAVFFSGQAWSRSSGQGQVDCTKIEFQVLRFFLNSHCPVFFNHRVIAIFACCACSAVGMKLRSASCCCTRDVCFALPTACGLGKICTCK